ncbi:MAG: type II toxin-antitoxin system HicA family toxin [Chloroflexota bacterium]
MKYREASKKLKALGCEEIPRRGTGSHRIWHNPLNNKIAPLPDWGPKDIKIGTLRAVIRQLGLDWQEFLEK